MIKEGVPEMWSEEMKNAWTEAFNPKVYFRGYIKMDGRVNFKELEMFGCC